jgi:hypothetical protein
MLEQQNDSKISGKHSLNDFKARLRSFHGAEKKYAGKTYSNLLKKIIHAVT